PELVHLRRRRPVGVQREEDAAAGRDGDVTGRIVEIDDLLDRGRGDDRCGRAVFQTRAPAAGDQRHQGERREGSPQCAASMATTYARMRAALIPKSPLPSRDFDRTSTRDAPSAAGRTRTTTSSWKRKSPLVATASKTSPSASVFVTVHDGMVPA